MKAIFPITLFLGSSFLVACGGSAEIDGDTSDSAAPGVNEESVNEKVAFTFTQTGSNTRNNPDEWFEEAEVLASTGQGELVYLEQLGSLLTHYIVISKASAYPAGLNYEITNELLGQNSQQIAVLDANHPRINQDGEIVDSWGTPYYFHSETSVDISIQSAGPDLIQYTRDDITYDELNQLAEVVTPEFSDETDKSGLELGAAIEITPGTFDTYETGELLPR